MSTENDLERVAILVVDDRPANLLALEMVLARPDYEIVLASCGAEALRCVLRRDFGGSRSTTRVRGPPSRSRRTRSSSGAGIASASSRWW